MIKNNQNLTRFPRQARLFSEAHSDGSCRMLAAMGFLHPLMQAT
jgi:hypothetical protein